MKPIATSSSCLFHPVLVPFPVFVPVAVVFLPTAPAPSPSTDPQPIDVMLAAGTLVGLREWKNKKTTST